MRFTILVLWQIMSMTLTFPTANNCKLLESSRNSISNEMIIQYAIEICLKYFYHERFVTIVAHTDILRSRTNVYQLLSSLQNELKPAIITIVEEGIPSSSRATTNHSVKLGKSGAFVIILGNELEFHFIFEYLQKLSYFNARAKYLVIMHGQILKEMNVKTIFEVSYQDRIFNMHIITVSDTCTNFNNPLSYQRCQVLLDYLPFNENISKPEITTQRIRNLNAINRMKLFPDKTRNLQGYPIRVSSYDVPPYFRRRQNKHNGKIFEGNFGEMLETISMFMNFTILPHMFWENQIAGMYLPNKTWTGIVGDVLYNRADVGPCAITQSYQRSFFVEFTEPIVIDQLTFAVPRSGYRPQWENIVAPFTVHIWILILTALGVMQVFVMIHDFVLRKLRIFKSNQLNTLNIFSVLLMVSIPHMPRSLLMKYVTLIWVCFSLIMSGIYQGILVSFMTKLRAYPELETFEDISQSDLTIITIPSYLRFIKQSPNPVLRFLTPRVEPVSSYSKGLGRICRQQDAALISLLTLLEYNKNTMCIDDNGEPSFYIPSESINQILLTYVVPMGSPYLPRWNTLILRAKEAGLVDKWLQDFIQETSPLFKTVIKTPHISISWNHLQSSFWILGIGLLISSLSICVELILQKPNKVENLIN